MRRPTRCCSCLKKIKQVVYVSKESNETSRNVHSMNMAKILAIHGCFYLCSLSKENNIEHFSATWSWLTLQERQSCSREKCLYGYFRSYRSFVCTCRISEFVCINCEPSREKATLWNLRKVSTMVSVRSPCSLTTVETFRHWQISCVLSNNSTEVNGFLEIIGPYRLVLASFPFL